VTRGRWAFVAAVAVGVLLLLARPRSATEDARAAFDRLATALAPGASETPEARSARLTVELTTLLTAEVSVLLPSGEELQGRAVVIDKTLALARGHLPVITLREVRTSRIDDLRSLVSFEVLVSDSQGDALHAAPRPGSAQMLRDRDGYRVDRLEIGAETRAEPEPRP
jgi:hypothetical protein